MGFNIDTSSHYFCIDVYTNKLPIDAMGYQLIFQEIFEALHRIWKKCKKFFEHNMMSKILNNYFLYVYKNV